MNASASLERDDMTVASRAQEWPAYASKVRSELWLFPF